ncbi:MAG: HAD family phosphatase [Saprospiraceae bacterium]|nr:HAD family phosphatase [Saprospiraceae bacterium]
MSAFSKFVSRNGIRGLLFDLNGTMVHDMPYHTRAWHQIFLSKGLDISYEDTKKECYGKNEEVIERVMPGVYPLEVRTTMGWEKEALYRKEFESELALLPGLNDFLETHRMAGLKMAIGSAAIMENVDFVLDGCKVRNYFDAIVSAGEVVKSKPDPETFLRCAHQLRLSAQQCLVFEDTPKGVECAVNAGMPCVVILTTHEKEEFQSMSGSIVDYIHDYHSIL